MGERGSRYHLRIRRAENRPKYGTGNGSVWNRLELKLLTGNGSWRRSRRMSDVRCVQPTVGWLRSRVTLDLLIRNRFWLIALTWPSGNPRRMMISLVVW
jgi:hypothetical protein